MTREVLARKLAALERYLDDLGRHRGMAPERLEEDPYRVERLLELVAASVDRALEDFGAFLELYRGRLSDS